MKLFGLDVDNRKAAFVLIFSAVGLLLQQFNFSQIVGVIGLEAKPSFTYFQFLGPVAGGVMGAAGGVFSVLLVAAVNLLLTGQALSLTVVVSALTMAAAVLYFKGNGRLDVLVPVACILLFWINPNGAEAWYYALFWLIPIASIAYRQNLFVRSLGATFSAHAIGSVAYLYAFSIPAADWAGLMFVTPVERLMFAAGIAVSYYAVNTVLGAFAARTDLSFLSIDKRYALVKA